MVLGIAVGEKHPDGIKARKKLANKLAEDLWKWWECRGSPYCRDLRKMYSTQAEYVRMGQRAAVQVENLLKTVK